MRDDSETIHVCHCCQFAARAIVDDLTANPDLLNIPVYKDLIDHVYLAARESASLARILGDEETGKFTDSVCNQLAEMANL